MQIYISKYSDGAIAPSPKIDEIEQMTKFRRPATEIAVMTHKFEKIFHDPFIQR